VWVCVCACVSCNGSTSTDFHGRKGALVHPWKMYRWLKLKYPTGQNAISRQPCEIFVPKFLDLYGIERSCKFLQRYGYINTLCHIFNFARNNQQQLVRNIVKKHSNRHAVQYKRPLTTLVTTGVVSLVYYYAPPRRGRGAGH